MNKSSMSSLNKRSLDISLLHKNEASYEFSNKKIFCTWPILGLALKGLNDHMLVVLSTIAAAQWLNHDPCTGYWQVLPLVQGRLGTIVKFTKLYSKFHPTALLNFACDG